MNRLFSPPPASGLGLCILALAACNNPEELSASPPEPVTSVAQAASPGALFGVLCQKEYQNGWQDTLSWSWNHCQGLVDELSSTDTKKFYWNLKDKKSRIETPNDQDLVETVDLLYLKGHGGITSDATSAWWPMWNDGVGAFTINMALGNEAHGLSILSAHSCDTLYNGDKLMSSRWKKTLRGGVRYVTGAWDTMWDGWTTDEVGEDYADDLQDGLPFHEAWPDATSDWYATQYQAVLATGADKADCLSRLYFMSWKNYDQFPRLANNAIHKWCMTQWVD
jgi:hypothetical protein